MKADAQTKELQIAYTQTITEICNTFVFSITQIIPKSKSLEAVIWTDLKSNFVEKYKMDFSFTNAISYLNSITGEIKIKAIAGIVRVSAFLNLLKVVVA